METGRTGRRIAIIAGSGRLPLFVTETLERQGDRPFIIALENEAAPALLQREHEVLHPGRPGTLLRILRRVGPDAVVMIGGVRARPELRHLRPDWTTLKLGARILQRLRSGDDALLRAVVTMVEDAGHTVVGVHELVPDLLASPGFIAGTKMRTTDRESLETALAGARVLGSLDAGQACVAIGRRVVALEGAEGTDAMLERVRELRASGRLSKAGGVLVKLAKPAQELRADLPTIGPETVGRAAAAGLAGIGIHAGSALIVDYSATRDRAEEAGLFVIGIDPDADQAGAGKDE